MGLYPLLFSSYYYSFEWESMAALSSEHRKMMRFGTLVVIVTNRNWIKFGVSRTNSITPAPVQKFTFLKVITFEHLL